MKHFWYKNYSKIANTESKERFKMFSKTAKRNSRINRLLGLLMLSAFVFWFIVLLTILVWSKKWISDAKVANVVQIVAGVLLFPFPIAMSILNYCLLNRFFRPVDTVQLTKELICKIAEPLRTFYKVPEKDYIVTKCTCSTLESMIDRDVLLFIVDDKLRVANDFFHSKYDFGCLEYDRSEIAVKYIEDNGKTRTLIKSKDFILYLGCKAKPFIYKHWLNKT